MEYKELDKWLHEVLELMLANQPEQALERLNALVQQRRIQEEEKWRIYEYYSTCYGELLDLRKEIQYLWQSVTNPVGQPLRIQQVNYSDYVFLLHYLPDVTDQELREKHFLYQNFFQGVRQFDHPLSRHRHERLRIGYLAEAMAENIGSYFAMQLFMRYDRSRYEIYCYSVRSREDDLTAVIRGQVRKLRVYPKGIELSKVAQEIYADEIDILFDLDVHNGGGRTLIAAGYKPAPVQLAGIGYMSTSGLAAMDYFLGDVYCDPPGLHDEDFSEQLIRLPHSHFCYTPTERVLRCTNQYRRKDYILFGSFNNFRKITDEMLSAWLRILGRVPGSRLLLRDSSHKNYALRAIERRARAIGFRGEQLILERPSMDYLDRYHDVDILLDTYPYTGGGTTCEALYQGVPVISRYGRRHGERFGYSLLQNIGLGELACATLEEYIEKAVALASDRNLLERLHQQIPGWLKQSPVMDGEGYVRTIEQIYDKLWAQWVKNSQ